MNQYSECPLLKTRSYVVRRCVVMSASSCARSCYYANWSSERDSDSGGIFSNPRDDPAGQQARRMYAIEQIRLCIFLWNITIIV